MFSPDGQSLAFWAGASLKRIAIAGGVPVTISRGGQAPSGGSWDRDGILFALAGSGIVRVSPDDGKSTVVIAANSLAGRPDSPQMLPGGREVLYTLLDEGAFYDNRWDSARIVVQSLDGGQPKTLVEGGSDARYVPTGHIVYVLRGTLLASAVRSRDAQFHRRRSARHRRIAALDRPGEWSGILRVLGLGRAGVRARARIRAGGCLHLRPPGRRSDAAASTGVVSIPPSLSRRLARRLRLERSQGDVRLDLRACQARPRPTRITFGSNNRYPIWSADGKRVAFQSDREGAPAVFWQEIGSGSAERLTTAEPGTSHVPESWSRDGVLLYTVRKGMAISLWSLSIADRQPKAFGQVVSQGLPTNAVFSPDGAWVAYQTGEADSPEGMTYVEPFPANGRKHEIGRGGRPVWSRDGTELFFVPAPTQFRKVKVTLKPTFSVTSPVAVPRPFGVAAPGTPRTFDFLPDGRIIGVGPAAQGPGGAELRVVLNWFEELKGRVAGR